LSSFCIQVFAGVTIYDGTGLLQLLFAPARQLIGDLELIFGGLGA
jgi:hypothetical protein